MRHHRRHHRGPPRGWGLIQGIHRRLIAVLLVAAALGSVAGASAWAAWTSGASGPPLWLAIAALLAIWPLAWVATFRIARPVRDLARVAGELGEGRLDQRDRLPNADGEVAEVAEALGGLADRVRRQLRDQQALMGAVSHELRSPLARVRVWIELLREGRAPDGVHDDLQREIDGMDALVADLLAAARIDFEAVAPQTLDAREVAGRAVALAQLDPGLIEGPAVAVRADPTLLVRALGVLLDNARRYGGAVRALRVVEAGERVRFEVDDDGPGFAPGEEVAAFQPFWRRPPVAGSPEVPGTGLGLALVRQIAATHGGEAGAGNRPGGGARVWLDLPAG